MAGGCDHWKQKQIEKLPAPLIYSKNVKLGAYNETLVFTHPDICVIETLICKSTAAIDTAAGKLVTVEPPYFYGLRGHKFCSFALLSLCMNWVELAQSAAVAK